MEIIESLTKSIKGFTRCGVRFPHELPAIEMAQRVREPYLEIVQTGDIKHPRVLQLLADTFEALNVWSFDTENIEEEGFMRYAYGLARLAGGPLQGVSFVEDRASPVHLEVSVGCFRETWDWPWDTYCPASFVVETMLKALANLPPVRDAGLVYGYIDQGQIYTTFCLERAGADSLRKLLGNGLRISSPERQ